MALIGPNGADKSTLIHLALSIVAPTSGKILVNGMPIKKGANHQLMNVGFVPDRSATFRNLTAKDNLIARSIEWGLDAKTEVPRVLELVGLDINNSQPVKQYSLGMLRKVDIATALLGNPSLLILDEPANGLDPIAMNNIWGLLKSLNRNQGVSLLLSSHDLFDLEKVATSVMVLSSGKTLGKVQISAAISKNHSLLDFYESQISNIAGVI